MLLNKTQMFFKRIFKRLPVKAFHKNILQKFAKEKGYNNSGAYRKILRTIRTLKKRDSAA